MYTLLYFVLLIYLFYAKYYPNKKVLMWSFTAMLCFIFGFRYDVGKDYGEYLAIFKTNSFDLEIGYEMFQYFFRKIDSFTLLVFFIFLITIYFINMVLKNNSINFIIWFYFIFISGGLLFGFLNIIRQGIAASILYFGINTIIKNKKRGIFFIFLACLFHKSVIFVCPLFIIAKYISLNKKIGIIVVVLFYILTIMGVLEKLIISFFEITKFSYKSYNINTLQEILLKTSKTFGIGIIMKICIFIIIVIYTNRQSKKLNYYENLYMIAILFSIIGLKNYVIGRLGIYFDLFSVFLIAKFFELKNLNKKMLYLKILVFSIFTLIYFKITMFSQEGEKIRYNNVFFINRHQI